MASVFLNDLANDYLNPSSQGCINPLFAVDDDDSESKETKENVITDSNTTSKSKTVLTFEDDIHNAVTETSVDQSVVKKKSKKASVSVADCLACSGCVTSTEAVLITNTYSLRRFREAIGDGETFLVFTVSEPSVVDITRYFDSVHSLFEVYDKLGAYLSIELNANMVISAAKANYVSLLEQREEFIYRYRKSVTQNNGLLPSQLKAPIASEKLRPDPSVALSAEETRFVKASQVTYHKAGRDNSFEAHSKMPMFVSSCPGWVCYVEKTAPYAIPFLSSVKSPMSISGAILKHVLLPNQRIDTPQKRIVHIAIMPCHDKKLEASRKDLAWNQVMNNGDIKLIPDVDLVITTAELLQLMKESATESKESTLNEYFSALSLSQTDDAVDEKERRLFSACVDDISSSVAAPTPSHSASQSGAYADFIFREASKEIYGVDLSNDILPWSPKSARNADLKELSLYRNGEPGSYSYSLQQTPNSVAVLRFAQAYGFRNIQGILHRMKKSGSMGFHYDFIEVMACPSGCLNGGGQIRHDTKPATAILLPTDSVSDEHLMTTKEKSRESPSDVRKRMKKNVDILQQRKLLDPKGSMIAKLVYTEYLSSGSAFNEDAKRLFHTRFHSVPPLALSSGIVEGVNPEDTKW